MVSAKRQCTIWGNTTHAESSPLHNRCTALKSTAFKHTNSNILDQQPFNIKLSFEFKYSVHELCFIFLMQDHKAERTREKIII